MRHFEVVKREVFRKAELTPFGLGLQIANRSRYFGQAVFGGQPETAIARRAQPQKMTKRGLVGRAEHRDMFALGILRVEFGQSVREQENDTTLPGGNQRNRIDDMCGAAVRFGGNLRYRVEAPGAFLKFLQSPGNQGPKLSPWTWVNPALTGLRRRQRADGVSV